MKKIFSKIFGEDVSVVRVTIMCIVLCTIVVSFYMMLSKSLSSPEETNISSGDELDIVITQDFVNNYPQNPKEVVKWYNRIITLYYDENLKNKKIEALCDQARMLLDRKLLDANDRDVFVERVKQEIADYKMHNRKIISSDVGSTNDVRYMVVNGDEMAYVTSYYFMVENNVSSSQYQTYALKRDGAGRYKIVAFQLTDEKGNPI